MVTYANKPNGVRYCCVKKRQWLCNMHEHSSAATMIILISKLSFGLQVGNAFVLEISGWVSIQPTIPIA